MGTGMHGMGTRMLPRRCLEAGKSKAELSRRFGVSRRTIHHWIESGRLDRDMEAGAARYAARPATAHRLDPYKGIIDARLAEYPKLSAQRLFDEVRAAGYPGGYGRVRDYVRESRPRAPSEPAVRFETPAGRQGQVDFGTFTLPWGRRHALLVVLGCSRLLWLRFFRRQTMDALFAGLEGAFARFGGVPGELLFDQMRTVVVSDDRLDGGALVANAEFQRFALHWGSGCMRAARTGPARRARWSVRSVTCGELLLRPRVRRRRGSGRAGAALAGGNGQRAVARHDGGTSGGAVRARRAGGAGAAGGRSVRARRRRAVATGCGRCWRICACPGRWRPWTGCWRTWTAARRPLAKPSSGCSARRSRCATTAAWSPCGLANFIIGAAVV